MSRVSRAHVTNYIIGLVNSIYIRRIARFQIFYGNHPRIKSIITGITVSASIKMATDRYPVSQPNLSTFASQALRNNSKGTDLDKEALERYKIRELCEGWGCYRDAAE